MRLSLYSVYEKFPNPSSLENISEQQNAGPLQRRTIQIN